MRKKYLGAVVGLILGMVGSAYIFNLAVAESCPELRVVFARGSGGERWHDQNYLAWKEAIETKLKLTEINYEFIDLDYPAVGVGLDNISTTVGAFFGAGDAYEFGASVDAGVSNLAKMVNGACKATKYVIGGYSQGAMVVSKALSSLNADRVIYAATFGDPKIYLPEGKSYLALDSIEEWHKNLLHTGTIPAACRGENLSDYRAYVPDCYAYKGLLGAYIPYEPAEFAGKVGTWCNKTDVFCSSYIDIVSHISYVKDALYEDAAKLIFSKITDAFGVENKFTSAHDTAILIDSTGSMQSMIAEYKAEALRLAQETLDAGGRVALYDYRDLKDEYYPVQHCDFESCDLETFTRELDAIECDSGGDSSESLLSAAFTAMSELKWQYGATKSVVVLTDAGYHEPDLDGKTFDDVVKLSQSIDPVNFYIVTNREFLNRYAGLAVATDGMVARIGEASIVTDTVMGRFDSLPRVEIMDTASAMPVLKVSGVTADGGVAATDGVARVEFETSGAKAVIVALNDAVLGVVAAEDGFVEIADLDLVMENRLMLSPISAERRGESVEVILGGYGATTVPKAPNTGAK